MKLHSKHQKDNSSQSIKYIREKECYYAVIIYLNKMIRNIYWIKVDYMDSTIKQVICEETRGKINLITKN